MPEGEKSVPVTCRAASCMNCRTHGIQAPMEEPWGEPAQTDGVVAVGVTAGRKEGDTQSSTDE